MTRESGDERSSGSERWEKQSFSADSGEILDKALWLIYTLDKKAQEHEVQNSQRQLAVLRFLASSSTRCPPYVSMRA
jgi:hypothetical protein